MTSDPDQEAAAWEPAVAIVISSVAALAGLIGLVIAGWQLNGPRQPGLEHIGGFLLLMAAMGATLAATVVGMIAAGIGLKRAKNRDVPAPALRITFVINLLEFWLLFLLPPSSGASDARLEIRQGERTRQRRCRAKKSRATANTPAVSIRCASGPPRGCSRTCIRNGPATSSRSDRLKKVCGRPSISRSVTS